MPARSAPANRLGFALSLCAVRYLGFCPEDLSSVPKNAAYYVGQQLMVPAEAMAGYPEREQTHTDHLRRVYEHLGYRRPSPDDLRGLFGWLIQRALEHDDAPLLVSLLAERLKREKFVRPGVSRLERMVAAARERAGEETFRALSPLLSGGKKAELDALLVPDADLAGPPNRTRHSWLKEGATSNTPRAILDQLEKIAYLRGLGADRLDLSALNPNRLKFLASLGRRHTNQALRRLAPARRYPVLLAFLAESHAEITDEVVDLFDRLLAQADERSRRDLDEFRKGASRAIGEKVRLFREVGEIVLDPGVSDSELRATVLGRVGSAERLEELVEESDRLVRPLEDNYYGFFVDHYAHLRRFAPAFLEAFVFRSGKQGEALVRAVELLKDLNASGKRRVPADAPRSFVPARWEPHILTGPGPVDRRHWEACLLWELRGALRSGDVWVEGSRRYADPQKYLIPKERWPSLKGEVRLQTGTSSEGTEQLAARREELGLVLGRLKAAVSRGGSIQVQAGRLVFSRDRSEGLPESALSLQQEVGERLPKVELTDLLVEVDRLTGFSRFFTHAGGAVPRTPDLRVHLYASILGQATNLGPVRMAELSDLSYRRLAWATNWYLREDTLKDAIAAVVNFHHRLPLSAIWGEARSPPPTASVSPST